MGGQTRGRGHHCSKKNYTTVSRLTAKSLGWKWTFEAQGQIVWEEVSDYYTLSGKIEKQSKF